MSEHEIQPGQRFEQLDADAVCEQCGTVNEEETLLCRGCGNNLRDQRARRIGQAGGPELMGEPVNRVRVLTGLLTLFGILIVLYAVLNIGNIEAGLISYLTESDVVEDNDYWSGPTSTLYEELLAQLDQYPTPSSEIEDSLTNPIRDESYNGRYVLLRPGELSASRVIGEANLSRRGNRVYFVATMRRQPVQIRGFAELEPVANGEGVRPTVRSTSSVRTFGEDGSYTELVGFGFGESRLDGGHTCYISGEGASGTEQILAYRVR